MMFDSVASCPHDAKTSLEAAESLWVIAAQTALFMRIFPFLDYHSDSVVNNFSVSYLFTLLLIQSDFLFQM